MKRVLIIDYLKTISVIFVIILHCGIKELYTKYFLFPFIFNMAVPIFMIVSGYIFTYSALNKNIDAIKKWFDIKNIVPKLKRFVIPFTIIFFINIILESFFNINKYDFRKIILSYITGGNGPGAYYFPILIQLLILFPFLYFIIKAKKEKGVIILILVQLNLEIITQILNVDVSLYRLLIYRYIIFLSFGIYLSLYIKHIEKKNLYISFLIGFIYIMLTSYFKYSPIIFKYWTTTSMPTALYIFPIVALLIIKFKDYKFKECKLNKIIILISKSSYHIFLVQMIYYNLGFGYMVHSILFRIIINIILCIIFGIIFHKVENLIIKQFL